MKNFLICLIFIINFHAHGETTWIECDIDDNWRNKDKLNKLEAVYQEYYVVITKEAENQTLEKGAYLFDKDFGKLRRVANVDAIGLKHIFDMHNSYSSSYSLNRETLYLENPYNGSSIGKCKLIKEVEWINITQNLIKETIKGNKF